MKKILIITLFALLTNASYSQYHVDSLYDNKDKFLIYSQVEKFDSLSEDMLSTKIKNWAGTHFVNMENVLVSETKEQLVFNYLSDSWFIRVLGMNTHKNWYFRMVVQIRDNKIKISIYDDGNAFWPGSYNGGHSVPATPARSYKFLQYFRKKGAKIDTSRKSTDGGLRNVRESCISDINSLVKSIKKSTIVDTDDDW